MLIQGCMIAIQQRGSRAVRVIKVDRIQLERERASPFKLGIASQVKNHSLYPTYCSAPQHVVALCGAAL